MTGPGHAQVHPAAAPAPLGSRDNPVPRRGARVLVVDGLGRVLLVRGADPGRPGSRYWFTVGGGLEPGEAEVDAAVRELLEETGLRVAADELRPLFEDETDFPYAGTWYRQRQRYFLLRVPAYEVPTDHRDSSGDEYILEHRWWTLAELEAADDPVYPTDLAATLRRLQAAAGESGTAP